MKYYSFYVGVPGSRMNTWRLEDLKMPALTIREAVILHHFQELIRFKYQKNFHIKDYHIHEPTQQFVFNKYRMILEFEKNKKRPLKQRVDYTLLNKIPVHRFCDLFEKGHPILG